jgi:hypothetical protein
VACPSPLVALIAVGADAAPCVVNAVELVPAVEFPTALTATTAKVYATPSVSPEHV